MDGPRPSDRPLRVCYPFVGNNVGGSHISTLMLISKLDPDIVEPVVVLHEEGALAPYMHERGLPYELIAIPRYFAPPYWALRNITALLTQTWRIAAFLRRARVDIVHANDVRIHFGWTLAAKLARIELIWHQRTGSFGKSLIKTGLAKLSSRVVCISRYTASTLPRQIAPLVRVVPNPFEVDFAKIDRVAARRNALTELQLTPDTRLIGFFGNLVQQKRPSVFLQAAAEVSRLCGGPLAFLLFGAERNDAVTHLTRLCRTLGIEDRVHFMGFRAPIEPWMASCDLIIAPGVGEGLGRSLVEAMIVGTPVVAADSGGHKEVIADGESGFLVTADDPQDFAAAASRLLNDTDLATRMAGRAQASAIRTFSTEEHMRAMVEIYRESLDHRSSRDKQSTAPAARLR